MNFYIAFIASSLLVTNLLGSAAGQQPKKVFRIGYLSSVDKDTDLPRAQATGRALRELGYVEGQNLIIEYRFAGGRSDRHPGLLADLVRLNVDLILIAGGTTPIRSAMSATKTIPIIMMGSGLDPVRAGIVESLDRPGGNVTGLTTLNTELAGKRLELFKEAVPKLARVAVLYNPNSPGAAREVKEDIPPAARALKLTIQPWGVRDVGGFDGVFAALTKQRPDGLFVSLSTGVFRPNGNRIANFALKNRLPSTFDEKSVLEAGGLMSYTADETEQYKRVAYFVDRVLKGAKPADLPVEQPTKFEFVINLRTANEIGLTIPQWTLMKADRVIR